MPKNTIVIMVRHGEKPDSGEGLSVAGQERAQAYVIYFQNYLFQGQPLKFKYLFASESSSQSHRPHKTINPLSQAINIPINDEHKDTDFKNLAEELLKHEKYHNSNILICWHHGEILHLAKALGVDDAILPSTANWPLQWPESVFGWVLQLVFDEKEKIDLNQTICLSEMLMYNDYGQMPPGTNLTAKTNPTIQLSA